MIVDFLHTLWSFFIILSVIVFIHEYGHYIIAKWCGVKIDAFSIGFGREVIGWNDRSGTRWKIAILPLGGYVKMYGDASAASTADEEALEQMSEDEKKLTFHHKHLSQKMAIVSAGPIANFLLAIAVFTYFIMTSGLPSIDPIVGETMPNSAAEEAGLQSGDRILTINDEKVTSFSDIPYMVSTNLGEPITLFIKRQEETLTVQLVPKITETDDGLGNKVKHPLIGIRSADITYEDTHLAGALSESVRRTYLICTTTLQVIGQMVTGQRSAKDLKGPIGIAKLSGQATDKSLHTTLWLIAMLSANLGLINLLPIPLLDGGHLLYYSAEAVSGRPVAEKIQEYGFRMGFAIIFTLMAFTIFNDISNIVMVN